MFYARNVAAGANTVTATFAKVIRASATVHVHEYSGVDRAAAPDATAGAVGSGTTLSSGTATTTSAGDLLFATGASTGTVTQPGAGWTARSTASGDLTADRLAAAAGAVSATATATSGSWVMQLVAFKPDASSADTTPPTVSVTAPSAGATVSGDVTVTASAADNVAVAGVSFFVDGQAVGAEDTSAPYSVTWPTTAATNGFAQPDRPRP